MLYNFEVVKHGSVLQTQTIHLLHIRDAWPTIVRLARRFRERGHRIRVKDQAGGIVKIQQTVRKLGVRGFLVGGREARIAHGSHVGIRPRPASVAAGRSRRLRGSREPGPVHRRLR